MDKSRNILNSKVVYIPVVVVLVVVIFFVILYLSRQSTKAPEQQADTSITVTAPAQGERYIDIDAADSAKQTEFLKAGAAFYGLDPGSDITPQLLATTCVQNASAEISQNARAVQSYRDNYAQIKADVRKANEICYDKYAEAPYVPPEKPQAHIDPETFQPIGH